MSSEVGNVRDARPNKHKTRYRAVGSSRTQEYTISYRALEQDHPPVMLTNSLSVLT